MRKWFLALSLALGVTGFAAASQSYSCCENRGIFAFPQNCFYGWDWCSGWELSVDYLYWKPTRTNLSYAAFTVDSTTAQVYDNKGISFIDPEWESGVRLALTKQIGCSCWEMGLRYTHLDTKTEDVSEPDGALGLISTIMNNSVEVQFDGFNLSVAGEYELDYDMVDVVAGPTFCLECLNACICPYTGFKYVSIDEEISTKAVTNPAVVDNISRARKRNCIDGYGLALGIGSQWSFWCDRLWFASRVGGGILYADVEGKWVSTSTFFPNTDNNIRERWDDLITLLEVSVGFGGTVWCGNCGTFGLEMGYDFQNWWLPSFLNLNTYTVSTGSSFFAYPYQQLQTARLGLNGLYVRGTFCF